MISNTDQPWDRAVYNLAAMRRLGIDYPNLNDLGIFDDAED